MVLDPSDQKNQPKNSQLLDPTPAPGTNSQGVHQNNSQDKSHESEHSNQNGIM
jgi:hypothetical protein